MLSGEAIKNNFIVFGLTRSGLEPTIYHTRGEHTNHYTTDAVRKSLTIIRSVNILGEIPLHFTSVQHHESKIKSRIENAFNVTEQ